MAERSAKDPGVKIRTFDPAGLCRGCFRTKPEVRGGKRLRKLDKTIRRLEALRAKRSALA